MNFWILLLMFVIVALCDRYRREYRARIEAEDDYDDLLANVQRMINQFQSTAEIDKILAEAETTKE